ncbi:DUF1376 domain-containing protein [Massilia sp. DD77]|uniref:DUF1376 domain-containing protein n=1 Tax=Massilia sp. DD77 TaxID=3109349 RepID=UPI002FFE6525
MTTSTNLPAPLTPEDCNLQDFAFMPLDVARLRDSDMAAYESPEACWAAVLLWSAAWHQVPAASLPDDDRFLAKAAGYGRVVKEWMNVREGALHGWVKCADGRLYHPVVAEKALESWKAKVHHQWKKECDRIRKANKQREAEGRPLLPLPPEPGSASDNIPQEVEQIPLESDDDSVGNEQSLAGNPLENALKGQGEGQGQGELKANPSHPATTQPELRVVLGAEPTSAGALSMAMRRFGINSSPGDLRLIALANQGITVDTVNAACEAAKKSKPDEAIPPAYVFSIVERWAKDAAELRATGAAQPHQVSHLNGQPPKFDPLASVNRNRVKP